MVTFEDLQNSIKESQVIHSQLLVVGRALHDKRLEVQNLENEYRDLESKFEKLNTEIQELVDALTRPQKGA